MWGIRGQEASGPVLLMALAEILPGPLPFSTRTLEGSEPTKFLINLKRQRLMDNKPTHYLYNVIDQDNDIDDEKRGIWTRIGAAWPHGDGKGFGITLDIPLVLSRDTRLVLREREELPAAQQSDLDEPTVEN